MPLRDTQYKMGQTIIKLYGYGDIKKLKIIQINCLRTAGLDTSNFDGELIADTSVIRGCVNDLKLDESIIRTRKNIFELAYCNPWDYFFTGTLNPERYERTDLEKYHKDFTQWLRDQKKKYGMKINFLVVPDKHSDGMSWHLHGFVRGIALSELHQFSIGDTMGKKLAEKVQRGDTVYNWLGYAKKFGFCDLEPIRNVEAVSKYMTKYITKDMANNVKELNAHMYYHSRGLKFAEKVKVGVMTKKIDFPFENEYCSVAWLDYSPELLQELLDSFE